ncbi:hypothetical protein [Luteolibacter sp. Populi]|uniref:hypothetical protein n=1 Tax=Luteolibacter sp. Populi TaxID=3230487 RepID=UPI003464F901
MTAAKLAARWRGWDAVDGFDNYPIPGSGGIGMLPRVVTLPQAELLDDSIGTGSPSALGRAFHSATPESFGLLTDTLQGGLKRDLTAYLDGTMPPTPATDIPNAIGSNANIIPKSLTAVAPTIKGPKWSALKKFRDLGVSAAQAGKLTVKGVPLNNNGEEEAAISPIMTDFRLLLGCKLIPAGTDQYRAQACAKIAVSLANPYPYPLQWTTPIELEVFDVTNPAQRTCCIYEAAGQPAFIGVRNGRGAALAKTIFQIPATTLQPGEAKSYTNKSSVLRGVNNIGTLTTELGLFVSSGAGNYEPCVIQDNDQVINLQGTNPDGSAKNVFLDVREQSTTSQINVELRSGGTLLKRVERFELDNANFAATGRRLYAADAKALTKAFGLQYDGFQISQPGFDYLSVLPVGDGLGLRSSTVRTFTDFNLQATRYRKPIISYNPPPYFMRTSNEKASLGTNGDSGFAFSQHIAADPLPWGRSSADSRRVELFCPPEHLVSLAQLQHADLTADDISVSVAHQPGNAVGNSYATPFVTRGKHFTNRFDITITDFTSATSAARKYYDMSYLLNAALWDTYFFSTIGGNAGSRPLNPSIIKIYGDDSSNQIKDGATAASRLMYDGAQNVNCTDKDAWKALLASSKHLQHKAEAGQSSDAIYPRSLEQSDAGLTKPTGAREDSFAGYRKLNDDQIDLLATELTKQVRLRGPFVSLSQFVNRTLAALSVQNAMIGRSGPLQAAIDAAGITINPEGTKSGFGPALVIATDKVNFQKDGSAPKADLSGGKATRQPGIADIVWPPTCFDENPGAVSSILADRPMLTDARYKIEQGFRSTGIPGWLTQADVLQVIGPALSVRSDTFRIRAYGEATDAGTGLPVARAWCEAVVQRMPEYVVDEKDAATVRPASLQSEVNKTFGRRFAMVSFKWLSPNEI